ncbi:MAG TPA: alkene reductase [Xanthobacteraceae bacterium]|nr:alkene reductase [Xanthobacteraceae bacterium]
MNAPLRDLFSPVRIGPYELPNRIVMAPMTRNRAGAGEVPTALMATYYAQRASAGLIVSEGTQIVPQGQGYPGTPGIHSAAQIAGWKRVTDAVHDRGGRIFCQLWHVGRISHPLLQPGGALPVAPSALVPAGQLWTQQGMQSYVVPRALEAAEIPGLVADYRAAAVNARQAGFDGVELHAANGYLIDQFLRDSTNRRTDRYGGSIANRARLLLEIAGALVDELGAALVGVRVSPTNPFNDIVDSDPAALFGHVAAALDRLDLAYLHVVEPGDADPAGPGARPDGRFFRVRWRGPLMLNKGYDRKRGDATVAEGVADLVSFATSFLANPDLPERLRRGGPFNPPDRPTFYGGGERGYTDYPALS